VASEQVLEEHVRSAAEMVEESAGSVPLHRLLASYARLHHLGEQDARKLRERLLAELGRKGVDTGALDGPRSPLRRLYRRLQGRVDMEFRDWVDRHAARVQLAVMDIHVQNALEMTRIVRQQATVGETMAAYAEMLGLRDTVAEIVGLRVLKALHHQESGQVAAIQRDRSGPFPLRVAENDG
jgi:hypothetical protein